jgi:hypothetical protein
VRKFTKVTLDAYKGLKQILTFLHRSLLIAKNTVVVANTPHFYRH